jgi:hypothetical protein
MDTIYNCSLTEKLEAYKTIYETINDFSPTRDDRWDCVISIQSYLGISTAEFNSYTGKIAKHILPEEI